MGLRSSARRQGKFVGVSAPWTYFAEAADERAAQGDAAGAERALRRAVAASEQGRAPALEDGRLRVRLGLLLLHRGELTEAGVLLERAQVLLHRELAPATPERAEVGLWLARQRLSSGLPEEAEATLLSTLGELQGKAQAAALEVELLTTLAEVYGAGGKSALAVDVLRRARELEQRGTGSPERLRELSFAIAAALSAAGREGEADEVRERLLAEAEDAPPVTDVLEAELSLWAAQREIASGALERAERRLREAIAAQSVESALPLRRALAYLLAELTRFEEAERELTACLAEASERFGTNGTLALVLSLDLAALRARMGQHTQAEHLLRALLERIHESPDELAWLRADALVALAALLIGSPAERGGEALPLLYEALGIQQLLGATEPHATADTLLQIAIAQGQAGDEVQARTLGVRAMALLSRRGRGPPR